MAEEQVKKEEIGKTGGKKKLIFILIPVILLLIGGGAGAYFFLIHKKRESTKQMVVASQKLGVMYNLGSFLVNLADKNANTYAKVSITLELSNEKVQQEVVKRLPIIKDAIINLLSSKTYDEIRTPEGKEELRLELIKRINAILVTGGVQNIYFTQFIVQSM
ncbi:flagellar basal body-associated protein FliL [Hydrogenobaculum sp. Y04AAS1]|uniref:flagellar basal body-associated FliL family protein n=1 Tax=Hydrogenobaculum sp. (strain Y04AAS1) TaxID=380749 RepID=UPI00015BCE1A|nr:flagellar basal body-associated protein FliL [Hydrogenobaculum sp. Y04AAS1]HCT65883.1 flagellar basal body protein FliL [Hydrogenobaculum sp.]